jgi:hypothetical protein
MRTHKKIVVCRMNKMKEVNDFKDIEKLLSKNKYSSEAIKELLRWYDYSEKKGATSY